MDSELEVSEVEIEVRTHLTPYEVIKLLNTKVSEPRPTQMGYNYVKKGYIKSEQVGTQILVPIEVANEWIEKFVTKNQK